MNNKRLFITDEDEKIREYVSGIVGSEIGLPLSKSLKSGVILCKMANKIIENSKKNTEINDNKVKSKNDIKEENKKILNLEILNYRESESPFIQRENIANFIDFTKKFLEPHELFETEDLFSERNLQQVRICLFALSRYLKFHNYLDYCIGPEIKEKQVFKPNKNCKPIFTYQEMNPVKDNQIFCLRRQITLDMMKCDNKKQVEDESKENLENSN